jgi:hypothetical protein
MPENVSTTKNVGSSKTNGFINLLAHDMADVIANGYDNTGYMIPDLTNNNMFLGDPNITQNTLPLLDPFIGGYFRLFCLVMPRFFPVSLRGLSSRMIERMCKGVSGLSDYELKTTEITYGNNGESYSVATGIQKGNNNFSLKFQEMRNSYFRKLFKFWTTGISDLGSGYGLYHGAVMSENLQFSTVNHSMVLLYVLTDNSGGAYGLESIEFSCLWIGAFPTKVSNSQFDATIGDHNAFELEEQFYGIFHESNTINDYAASLLERSNFWSDRYNDYNVGSIVASGAATKIHIDDDLVGNEVGGYEPQQQNAQQYEYIYDNNLAALVKQAKKTEGGAANDTGSLLGTAAGAAGA